MGPRTLGSGGESTAGSRGLVKEGRPDQAGSTATASMGTVRSSQVPQGTWKLLCKWARSDAPEVPPRLHSRELKMVQL